MDRSSDSTPLDGGDAHGFHTLGDLSIWKLLEEASSRWLRPNEVLAILSNHKYFKIQPQPVDKPQSGRLLLFDRKVLRNFRQDGHKWKRKKDGKSIQEAHEKLKIGNEERVHVYYARGEDDPSFYRRSYWLLDKNKDRIVLVHYRQISEDKKEHLSTFMDPKEVSPSTETMQYDSSITPMNSACGSAHSDLSGSAVVLEEINSGGEQILSIDAGLSLGNGGNEFQYDEYNLDDIGTIEWGNDLEDLMQASIAIDSGCIQPSNQQIQYDLRDNSLKNANFLPHKGIDPSWNPTEMVNTTGFSDVKPTSGGYSQVLEGSETSLLSYSALDSCTQKIGCISNQSRKETPLVSVDNIYLSKNSFGRLNHMNDDSHGLQFHDATPNGHKAFTRMDHFTQKEIFTVVDISPTWGYCTEETKVLVIGSFSESSKHLLGANMYCVFGEICVAAEMVQDGVYRCTALCHNPGSVNFFLTLDGNTPISQVLTFDYRPMPGLHSHAVTKPLEDDNVKLSKMERQVQTRLAHLLFSTTNTVSLLSSKRQPNSLKKAEKFVHLTSSLIDKEWKKVLKYNGDGDSSYVPDSEDLCELLLKQKLQEWLMNKVVEGCKITDRDRQGQGAIHLCAILDYAWAVRLFQYSGFSLDFRDSCGWTALHWAAYYGREKMAAVLLSFGADASLVTYSTPQVPGGCTAADLASLNGYEGLAAYLAEKGLYAHANAMKRSGNLTAPLPPISNDVVNYENLSEQELCLKDSLAAYRNAADAAARIQDALRERALKVQMRAVEMEASQIVSALKIQHAFRKYNRRKMMKAAARIQSHFRTWQTRKNFLNMRRHAIVIQAAFRGHQARRQYCKVIWSVGVLEKAILRWRLKRKGLRGIKTEATESMEVDKEQDDNLMEQDFFRIGREQAEERMQRSVVKVQTMFRSYRAQQDYRRMKLAHEQAKLEFDLGDDLEDS